jgi:hypothetical protein
MRYLLKRKYFFKQKKVELVQEKKREKKIELVSALLGEYILEGIAD